MLGVFINSNAAFRGDKVNLINNIKGNIKFRNDHTTVTAPLPVCSAMLSTVGPGLVLRWGTTLESVELFFCHFTFCFVRPGETGVVLLITFPFCTLAWPKRGYGNRIFWQHTHMLLDSW